MWSIRLMSQNEVRGFLALQSFLMQLELISNSQLLHVPIPSSYKVFLQTQWARKLTWWSNFLKTYRYQSSPLWGLSRMMRKKAQSQHLCRCREEASIITVTNWNHKMDWSRSGNLCRVWIQPPFHRNNNNCFFFGICELQTRHGSPRICIILSGLA